MKKVFLFFGAMILVLMGCQSPTDEALSTVGFAHSEEIGQVNTDFFVTLETEEDLVVFQDILASAEKIDGIVDIDQPDYDVEVTFADGHSEGFHLWLGEIGEESTWMDVADTHTIYTLPKEATEQFLGWIE